MTDKKFTDEEIIKAALEEEIHLAEYVDSDYCSNTEVSLLKSTLDLINRQKSEIEVLYQINAKSEKEIYELRKRLLSRENLEESFNRSVRAFDKRLEKTVKLERAAAYKECIEKVKEKAIKIECVCSGALVKTDYTITDKELDNIIKETDGE